MTLNGGLGLCRGGLGSRSLKRGSLGCLKVGGGEMGLGVGWRLGEHFEVGGVGEKRRIAQ